MCSVNTHPIDLYEIQYDVLYLTNKQNSIANFYGEL